MIDKSFDPKGVEEKWYGLWLEKGYFQADSKSDKPSYCIVIPPPNVTGSLHIGHALDITLQDIMVRWKRMSGFNTLWLPGTDHAGIATQNVVEKELKVRGMSRQDLGREAFIKKVWEWKEQYGGRIIHQLKRLGASCDWSRERFTLDEGLSRAVKEVFVRLHKEGLIYRGDYIINWCPRCHTALSDLEVEHEEVKGRLYHIRYNFAKGDGHVVVATTRPETLLGDTAVAVNPNDKRYKNIVGKVLSLPVLGREIPVVGDEFVDVGFGTGAVKVTPAHDPNDFEIAQRHNLPFIKIMTGDAKMTDEAGPYKGQDRFKCREHIIRDLKTAGLLVEVKDHKHGIGHCYRCKTVVEPYLSKQWFVKIKPLAEDAARAVRKGTVKIIPQGWENSYFDWMENIKDWCISRQIWWGHRIPVWYCSDMKNRECKDQNGIVVTTAAPEDCPYCGSRNLVQDEDVLDTWFSSALWPFSTLGWPDDTDDLRTFYPTSVLITGFDILFFWVARMIMMGMKFMDREPFRHVYIHALVRDATGHKMSKSKGNVVDPLEMTDTYGTDSFRFTLAAFAAQGRDIKFSVKRIEGYRNFINKIWNAARFILVNIKANDEIVSAAEIKNLSLADRWILSRLSSVAAEVNSSLEEYRFNDAANLLYQFVWHEFCDWYVELIKPVLYGSDEDRRRASLSAVVHVFEVSLGLLHPFIPFVTEELWQHLPASAGKPATAGRPENLCVRAYPTAADGIVDKNAESKMALVKEAVMGVRSIRGELNLSPSLELKALIRASDETVDVLNKNISYISKLAKTSSIEIGCDVMRPEGAAVSVNPSLEIFVPLKGLFDVESEIRRLNREAVKIEESLSFIQKKLSNEEFVNKAPKAVVDENEAKYEELNKKMQSILSGIDKLKQLGNT
ncbi:MAG TPA: valine--tRNA ligase [Nitrospirae bacterium]|nr:valine--tRNA ligase [bacterium BMS3Abin10]GBE38668.1 valine--tRNA ligase [bacterium BMS3Bbin08]HDK82114.1 valine--tRNA ligase [Nitrospirota bacterium]